MYQLEFMQAGRETKRFHTTAMLQEQNIADHSWGVAMLCALIAQDNAPPAEGLRVPLLMAALTHDLAEHKMGDIPSPAKRALGPAFKSEFDTQEELALADSGWDWGSYLTPKEAKWLKYADNMEGALRCIRERAMGNRLIRTVFNNYRMYLSEMMRTDTEPGDAVTGIVQYIDDMWEQYDG